MSDKIIDWRAFGRRRGRPLKAAGFGDDRAPTPDGPSKCFGLDEADMRKVVVELGGHASAAPDDKRERSTDAIGELAELLDMPVDAFTAPTAGRELESQHPDFWPFRDQFGPALIVAVRTGIDMKRSGHAGCRHFGPREQDALHGVEIVGPRHIGEDAIVWRRHKRDTETRKAGEDLRPVRKLPPAFNRAILAYAAQDDGGIGRDEKPVRKTLPRADVQNSRRHVDDLVE